MNEVRGSIPQGRTRALALWCTVACGARVDPVATDGASASAGTTALTTHDTSASDSDASEGGTTGGLTTDPGLTTDATTTSSGGSSTTTSATDTMDWCSALGEMECAANRACMGIRGGKFDVENMCVGPLTFLACVEEVFCGDAMTVACDDDSLEPWLFLNLCIPPGFSPCPGDVFAPACP